MKSVKAISSPNLAIIKYWGKEDVKENVPSNMSISFKLDKLTTETTIKNSENGKDNFIFNGEETVIPEKMANMIVFFKRLVDDKSFITIESKNNFPHSAGLASSASGYSALILSLDKFYETNFSEKDLSILARKCSGSASRSIPDGIVLNNKEYSYSIGDWPELKIFLILIDDSPKKIGSTEGMKRTQSTSFFYSYRLSRIPYKINLCMEYIKSKDFVSLSKMIMRDSNETHAVCMETYPPIRYINDEAFSIIEKVHDINCNGIIMAYSFDAGTNPFIITLEEHSDIVYENFKNYKIIECN